MRATRSAATEAVPARRRAVAGLRVLAVLGLGVNAFVHLRLAPVYDQLGTELTQGMLFRAEAAVAAAAAAYLAVRDSRPAWALAGLVSLAGVVAVLVTRYLSLPAVGPVPAMHDPQWTPDKVWVTVAMGGTVLLWLVREILRGREQR
jgi:hypothetical protein